MAQQNQKNTRKNRVVKAKVNKNIKKVKKPNFFEEHKNSEKKQKNTKTVDNSSDKIARKDKIWKLLNVKEQIGIGLTESRAMFPAASVCGWYFAHPKARYFSVLKNES